MESVEAVTDSISAELRSTAIDLPKLVPEPLRQLIYEIVVSAKVDMAKKAVTFERRLPPRVLYAKNSDLKICETTGSRSMPREWTHQPFAVAMCKDRHDRGSTTGPPCCVGRRKTAYR